MYRLSRHETLLRFTEYVHHFRNLLPLEENVKAFFVPGNTDVGYVFCLIGYHLMLMVAL